MRILTAIAPIGTIATEPRRMTRPQAHSQNKPNKARVHRVANRRVDLAVNHPLMAPFLMLHHGARQKHSRAARAQSPTIRQQQGRARPTPSMLLLAVRRRVWGFRSPALSFSLSPKLSPLMLTVIE